MSEDLMNKKAAILVANGFCEREYNQAVDALSKLGAIVRLVAPDDNLMRGWNKEKIESASFWGESYAPDVLFSDALASEYDILVIPGGQRSIEKLALCAQMNAFVSAFVKSKKPVIAYNQAVELLLNAELIYGCSVAATNTMCDSVKAAGGRCAAPEFVVSKNLITLSRYRDEASDKLVRAILSVMSGERYVEKVVSAENMPNAHKAA